MALSRQESKLLTHGCKTLFADTTEGRKIAATSVQAIATLLQNTVGLRKTIARSQLKKRDFLDYRLLLSIESDPTTRLAAGPPTPETQVRCRLLLQMDSTVSHSIEP